MDQNEEVIHDFECLLKQQETKKIPCLYAGREKQALLLNKPETALITFRARDVLESVSRQIQALQNADTVSCKQVGSKLDKYKKGGFLSVDMIPVDEEVTTVTPNTENNKRPNHFETQFVSNTQLINIIENAEIIDKHRGVTQEFDTTFIQKSDDNDEIFENNDRDKNVLREQGKYNVQDTLNICVIQDTEKQREVHFNDINVTSEMDTLTCLLPNNVDTDCGDTIILRDDKSSKIGEATTIMDVNKVIDDEDIENADIPISPVFSTKRMLTPPLVFSLYAFERFENLALPIIEEHADLETAKKIIKSQIIGKDLIIPSHTYTSNDIQSPILGDINIDAVEIIGRSNLTGRELSETVLDKNLELHDIQSNICLGTEFKDELLFSSDEEEDYVHKDIQELPLTCALETSFYDKSDILDNTMYVGFQTASNKSIQISTDSFSKAKSILSDIDCDKTSLKDLVNIFDSENQKSSDVIDNNKHYTKNNESFLKIEYEENSEHMSELKIQSGEDMGNTLKNIPITNFEKEDVIKDDNMMSQVIEIKSVSTPSLKERNDAIKNYKKRKFEGFKTANNKIIKLSEKARAQCREVFRDIDLANDFEPVPEPERRRNEATVKRSAEDDFNLSQDIFEISDNTYTEDDKPKTTCKKEDNVMSQINDLVILQEFEDNDMKYEETYNNCFVGLKTASKKDIVMTEEALIEGKEIFHDILITNEGINSETLESASPCNTDQNDIIFKKPVLGLKITAKTKVNDSKEPFSLHRSGISGDFKKPSTSKFVGFKTAANNEIKISKEAIDKFKNFYKEVDEEYKSSMIEEKHVLFNSIEKEKMIDELVFNEEFFENKFTATPVYVGFQTASKKIITISEKALAESKKLFKDITDCEKDEGLACDENKPSKNILEQPKTYNAGEVNKKCRDLDFIGSEAPIFRGFQTGSNKKVEISDEALAKSKKLFQDMDLGQTINPIIETISRAESNFQVKRPEKPENISETPAMRNKNVKPINNNNVQEFVGFKTASLKPVKISSESLAKSRRLLNEFEAKEVNNKVVKDDSFNVISKWPSSNLVAFKTASNQNVQITSAALVKGKEIFLENVDNVTDNDDIDRKPATGSFVGFQTASNKNITISAKALAKSKQLLSEFELNDESNMIESDYEILNPSSGKRACFQKASNKKVQISEDAVTKSKQMLSDFECNDECKKIDSMKPPTSEFVDFHTTSNKEVTISNDDLIRSKKMFTDIDNDYSKEKTEQEKRPFFKGFQTASNRRIEISEKALANSKKIFEDISQLSKSERNEVPCDDDAITIKELYKTEANINILHDINEYNKKYVLKTFTGFHTASNKKDFISEEALATTQAIFNDMHEAIINNEGNSSFKAIVAVNNRDHKSLVEVETETNINNANTNDKDIIDTQVLNDFQDSLHTEDFCKSTPKSKRSGSPILSCPRAKKRRFLTPYRTEKKIEPKSAFVPPKPANMYKFKENYKKNKKYTLRDLLQLNKDVKSEIDPYVSAFNFERLTEFEFIDARNDHADGKINIDQLKNIFLDAVNKKIIPDGWLDNHVHLIIWKLLSYEIKFPNSMRNTCTVRNVLDQLKYRYDKELFNVERPILRKILEKDDVPSKTMVLCVVGIYVDDVYVASVPSNAQNVELLLTDGWYTIRASLDRMLCRLVSANVIKVGCKLATSGAELLGCEQARAPWEDLSTVRLRLSGNSTRRARWFAPLGGCRGVIRSTLKGARGDGGRAAVVALVVRVYPPLYAEKREGSTVILSERLEHIRQMQFERERQVLVERIYEELEKELADQESQDSEGLSNENTDCLETGSQISRLVNKCRDPEERAQLTESQNRLLEEHNARRREKKIEEIRVKFREKLDKSGLETARNVVPLLKVRVADFREHDCGVEVTTGYLSIWKPSTEVVEIVKEGAWVEILNVLPTGVRNSEIQLSAGRQVVFRPYGPKGNKFKIHADIIKRKSYKIKELAENPSMTTYFNEIDTTGIVVHIELSPKDFDEKKNNFQNVFLADADKNMICVNFWGGIKKFGFEYLIDTGQIITCVNLQKRAGNTRKSIPHYRVTEFTRFTKTPKDKEALEVTKELTEKLTKIKEKFCEDCVALKNNYTIFKTRNNENLSPYRIDGKIVSAPRCDANLNLTGLDFESSFKDTEISPMALLRKKQVNEKIQKLRMYGEPPPLSSIHIINKSKNASADYKSPVPVKPSVSNMENQCLNVASVEKRILQNTHRPISLNRTYVKKVNPVKLNFSNSVAIDNDLNDSVDHFAEEFESSPPLSLDSDVLL